ncbi:quinolinate synthase NadA [Oceanotoga teriensis]|uniref:quinolinate synthase NadA n=1 Tax=Oceanotoga teriensis TaxID=515440 RepID=UPI002712CD2B|nr:quinolinate synthase NadA [Oceanotoga teriensis]MDO7977789.1 quinolinate synthase NadA [Oceanotoga teriensis]
MDLLKEIKYLKEKKNFIFIGHNYVEKNILDLCDYNGDSLGLAKVAQNINKEKNILFIGVDFMAETMKILNPEKRIFVANKSATCPMANSLSPEKLLYFKSKFPNYSIVLYVNSTAECKRYADCVCTSANAVEIVNAIDNNNILFGPDKNLANYVKEKTKKNVLAIPGEDGFCYVHDSIENNSLNLKSFSDFNLIVHPECKKILRDKSFKVGSTGQMPKFISENLDKKYIIGTEIGMVDVLKNMFENVEIIPFNNEAICHDMKKNKLEDIYNVLNFEINEILLDRNLINDSRRSIINMFKLMEV